MRVTLGGYLNDAAIGTGGNGKTYPRLTVFDGGSMVQVDCKPDDVAKYKEKIGSTVTLPVIVDLQFGRLSCTLLNIEAAGGAPAPAAPAAASR